MLLSHMAIFVGLTRLFWTISRCVVGFCKQKRHLCDVVPTTLGGIEEVFLHLATGKDVVPIEERLVEEVPFHEFFHDAVEFFECDARHILEDSDAGGIVPKEVIACLIEMYEQDDGCELSLGTILHGEGADADVVEEIDMEWEVVQSCFHWSCHGI